MEKYELLPTKLKRQGSAWRGIPLVGKARMKENIFSKLAWSGWFSCINNQRISVCACVLMCEVIAKRPISSRHVVQYGAQD